MSLLTAYRHQLAEERAGHSHRFADVLSYFRKFWYFTIALAVAFLAWGIWEAITLPANSTAGMALIVFPVGALVLVLAGAVPYKLAQLFLSVKPISEGDHG